MVDNPYPGLRPFEQEDSHLFFGRELLVHDMLRRLTNSRLLAVTGSSGCGKSSLVRAGLVEEIDAGFVPKPGMRWRVVMMRPGAAPISALAKALEDTIATGSELGLQQHHLRAMLDRGASGLIDVIKSLDPKAEAGKPTESLLLIVDQFEEIFRYNHKDANRAHWLEQREEAQRFVELLLHSVKNGADRVYVVLTMRVDFLDDCANFEGLAEAVSDGQFLVPRLTREQAARAIAEPAKVMGGSVDEALLGRILNDMATDTYRERAAAWDNPDLLPLMQHVLARMWEIEASRSSAPPRLTLALYESLGGVDGALSKHLNETRAALPERLQEVSRLLFTGLVRPSAGVGGRDIRNPLTVAEACAYTGASSEEIEAVYKAFSGPGKNFLVLSGREGLTDDARLDISHESLIRQWDQLQSWTRNEESDADLLNTLVARAYGGDDPPRGASLAGYLEMVERRGATLPAFIARTQQRRLLDGVTPADIIAKVRVYLDAGVAAEREKAREAERRMRRRALTVASVLAVMAVTGFGGAIYAANQTQRNAEWGNRLLVEALDKKEAPLAGLVLLRASEHRDILTDAGQSRFIEAGLYSAADRMFRGPVISSDNINDCPAPAP
ncbi:MAG TPA: hypothetical protein VG841_16050, partial [Caulobacterales bacterium]|nr:hypothetical protein [Caulobacterales bacterium]